MRPENGAGIASPVCRMISMARAGVIADGAVGVVNGVIGGATGLAGIAAVIWCNLRGWPPPEQRAVFQPSGVAVFAMTGLWLGGTGMVINAMPTPRLDWQQHYGAAALAMWRR
jgi:hypothetical protein